MVAGLLNEKQLGEAEVLGFVKLNAEEARYSLHFDFRGPTSHGNPTVESPGQKVI